MVAGKLKVHVVSASKLKNKERFQKSDPYCMIEYGKETKKTKTIDNNLNPVWKEDLLFNVSDLTNETLAVSIWDKNTLTKDNFMGFTYASFTDCPKDKATKKVSNQFILASKNKQAILFFNTGSALQLAVRALIY